MQTCGYTVLALPAVNGKKISLLMEPTAAECEFVVVGKAPIS